MLVVIINKSKQVTTAQEQKKFFFLRVYTNQIYQQQNMSQKTVILVTGANGNTGKAVAQHLLKRADRDHYVVKVGARSEDKVADLVKLGAHYVKVDFSDAESLHAAVKGVDRVWATAPNPTKQQKENDRIHLVNNLIDAAKEANVKYFLFGSVLGARKYQKTRL
jgi:uncharacterized protein YbjT (DUF2867 family)